VKLRIVLLPLLAAGVLVAPVAASARTAHRGAHLVGTYPTAIVGSNECGPFTPSGSIGAATTTSYSGSVSAGNAGLGNVIQVAGGPVTFGGAVYSGGAWQFDLEWAPSSAHAGGYGTDPLVHEVAVEGASATSTQFSDDVTVPAGYIWVVPRNEGTATGSAYAVATSDGGTQDLDADNNAALMCDATAEAGGQAHTDAQGITTALGSNLAALGTLNTTGTTGNGDLLALGRTLTQIYGADQSVDPDVQAVGSDVIALGAGKTIANLDDDLNGLGAGKTIASLDTDLAQLDTDVQTLHADNLATQSDLTSSGGPASEVELSPADRQLVADSANGAHDDLWILGGAMLGIWLASVLARALWGS
jgi:hypothetical protein